MKDEGISETTPRDENSYDAALLAVRHAIEQFEGCSEEDRTALTADIDRLRTMGEKLEAGRLEIVVFGEISTGKSALINALVGDVVTQVNVQGGWTKDVWHVDWNGSGYCVPGFARSQVVLVDTPGLNEVDGAARAQMAHDAAARADMVLFVTDSDLNETEYMALSELASGNKPILLVFNKIDLYAPSEREQLIGQFTSGRLAGILDAPNVILTAADPRSTELCARRPTAARPASGVSPRPTCRRSASGFWKCSNHWSFMGGLTKGDRMQMKIIDGVA